MNTQSIFPNIHAGDLEAVRGLLDDDWGLVHARHADPKLHHWTTLQFAAAEGQLPICQLLVERGAEVYSNPMNTYPPVIQAAWNDHQEVVDYFLNEIPEKADGTNRLGVAINLAARQGWIDLLLNAGAEVDAMDARGKTALDYALERRNERIEAVLRHASNA